MRIPLYVNNSGAVVINLSVTLWPLRNLSVRPLTRCFEMFYGFMFILFLSFALEIPKDIVTAVKFCWLIRMSTFWPIAYILRILTFYHYLRIHTIIDYVRLLCRWFPLSSSLLAPINCKVIHRRKRTGLALSQFKLLPQLWDEKQSNDWRHSPAIFQTSWQGAPVFVFDISLKLAFLL